MSPRVIKVGVVSPEGEGFEMSDDIGDGEAAACMKLKCAIISETRRKAAKIALLHRGRGEGAMAVRQYSTLARRLPRNGTS